MNRPQKVHRSSNRMRPLKTFHILKNYAAAYVKYGTYGNSIRLDASSLCQLTCAACPQSSNTLGIIGQGYLRFEDFKEFVEGHPEFENIELSNWGEIFLNPELVSILAYAFTQGIRLTACNGVNLNGVSEEMLELIVKYRVREMTVSLDGASNTTYPMYRSGGNFEDVIRSIKKINRYKEKYRTDYPELSWQFIIFGHNEEELPVARRMAQDLRMKFEPKLNWDPSYSPVRNTEYVKGEVMYTSVEEYEKDRGNYLLPCRQLWGSPQINWDGRLLGCCVNTQDDYGNVFKSGLRHCIRSEKYRYAQAMLLGKKPPRDDIPCCDCRYYKKMIETKKPLKLFDKSSPLKKLCSVLKNV